MNPNPSDESRLEEIIQGIMLLQSDNVVVTIDYFKEFAIFIIMLEPEFAGFLLYYKKEIKCPYVLLRF
jgi:hypothetical protein